MKKSLFIVAIATLFIASCQKENEPAAQNAENKPLSFKASIEQLEEPVKGTINASNQLVWAKNDLIGIYFPDWGDKNQPFKLNDSDAGNTVGEFTIATAADPSGATATCAYYPWWDTESGSTAYPSSSQTNVWEGIVYFKLKSEYWGYSDGKMLTPLVAPITSSSDNISFKHAGAAVKLTVNNLVSGTYHTTMTVAGKQITGGFHVNPANAGTEALALDAAEDASQNHVTLHTWKSNGAFTWIFPVPELTKPKLQFEITDNNGVPVWSKNLKAQANDLGRGDLLVMPAIDVTPYAKFAQDDACTWSFSGNINGSAWQDNVPMVSDGKYWILAGFTFKDGDKFKIRKDKDWGEAYPDSDWLFNAGNAGAKDIIFNSETKEIKVVDHSCPYPTVNISASISIDGSLAEWEAIPGQTNGNNTVKVASDNTNIYIYTKRTNAGRYSEIWGGVGYVYVGFDVDGNSTNGESLNGNGPYDFVGFFNPYDTAYTINLVSIGDSVPSPYTLANMTIAGAADADAAEIEICLPRADIPTISTSIPTTITVWGSKDMSKVSISKTL